jgi:hypothetical protein
MNSNWRTPNDARELCCAIMNGNTCMADHCAQWLWRPCEACDTGAVIARDGNMLKNKNCDVCNGTGHDGSGLGRCGLVRG